MKEEIARSIMSDEAWDMVWEGLKEYCKINGMAEDYIKYDTYFRSHLQTKEQRLDISISGRAWTL